ncbi:hypothetical protein Taro_026222 [Colocasia esculenta]|uniref:Uncharacterized protein n=1 Tax=Colocasia esculenta TaxID=4460 RepID=A0A843VGI6_COLES|nr:hypothetical protein [Colocasia esculenta]
MRCVFGLHLTYMFFLGRPLVSTLLDLVSTHCPKSAQKVPDSILQKATSLAYTENIFMPIMVNQKKEGPVVNVGARTRSKAKAIAGDPSGYSSS